MVIFLGGGGGWVGVKPVTYLIDRSNGWNVSEEWIVIVDII